MDLEGKLVPGVEDFDEQRETVAGRLRRAEEFVGMVFHEPAEILAGMGAVGDDADVAGAVRDFPTLADGNVRRQIFL